VGFLDIRGVSKTYGSVAVLHDIDLSVDAGEFLVLVGPSGCGKSTLLNLIAGLDSMQTGEIALDGVGVNDRTPAERNIAMVFQSYALYPNMTVRDNLGFGLRMRRVERAQRARAIDEVATLLQIEELLERKPRELSGGQRQRVAMGRALVRKPSLFLFDEPLSNLDARLRIEMRTMIKRLHQKFGTTTVYVTHDQVEAMTLATRIAVMDRGRLQQVGKPHEVYGSPANMFVAGFMGAPSMNLIEARLAREPGRVAVQFPLGDGSPATLLLPEPGLVASYPRDEVVLGLRPEAITDGVGADPSAALQFVTSRVDVVEPAGSDTFVVTRMGRTDVVARLRADSLPQAGDSLRLAVDMAKCVLFDPVTRARL
jgi:multiple sugar transport system ATP-binding protein